MRPMCMGYLPTEVPKCGVVQPWIDDLRNSLFSSIKEIREETQDNSQYLTAQVARLKQDLEESESVDSKISASMILRLRNKSKKEIIPEALTFLHCRAG